MQLEMAARAFGDPDEGWSSQEQDLDSFNDALTWGDLPLDSDRHSGSRCALHVVAFLGQRCSWPALLRTGGTAHFRCELLQGC